MTSEFHKMGNEKMVNTSILKAVCTCLLILISFSTNAAFIVDTGPGSTTGGGSALNGSQWLAGRFSVTNAQTVTSVEGWFGEVMEGTITAAIYTDNGSGVPITELFSSQFILDNPSQDPIVNAWDGAFDLRWLLNPGTYWLSFEVRADDTAIGWITIDRGSRTPGYASNSNSGDGWFPLSDTDALNIRVDAVPVPPAVWLFGSGLIGLIGMARQKKA